MRMNHLRTTITLDPDVAERVKLEMQRTGHGFNATLNDLIRAGLATRDLTPALPPFRIRARDLGLKPGLSLDDVEGLLDQIDGPNRR